MKKMGWSSHYRFNVIVSDINGVKLIAKAGLNAETPTFDSTSDTIDGVSEMCIRDRCIHMVIKSL